MARVPTCPDCGSRDVEMPGTSSFRFTRGKWRVVKGSVRFNESADVLGCSGCGASLDLPDDWDPPFNLAVQRRPTL